MTAGSVCYPITTIVISSLLFICLFVSPAPGMGIKATYLYNLSDFDGLIPYNWARVYVDNGFKEVYVFFNNEVHIFNNSGMDVFEFFSEYRTILDLTVDPGGNLILLVNNGTTLSLVRCNYRGEPIGEIRRTSNPAEYPLSSFTEMRRVGDKLYFANLAGLRVEVFDMVGNFVKGYDLAPSLVDILSNKEMKEAIMGGFDVDSDGNIFFTLPIKGGAYRLNVDGTISAISRRGSGPGKFGVPSAIAVDRMGNVFVCDKLRCVVVIFDKELNYITEFGYRGLGPGNLVVPVSIAIGDDGMVYVSQLLRRGVSVFHLEYN